MKLSIDVINSISGSGFISKNCNSVVWVCSQNSRKTTEYTKYIDIFVYFDSILLWMIIFRFVGDIFIGLENFWEDTKMIKIYQLSFSPCILEDPHCLFQWKITSVALLKQPWRISGILDEPLDSKKNHPLSQVEILVSALFLTRLVAFNQVSAPIPPWKMMFALLGSQHAKIQAPLSVAWREARDLIVKQILFDDGRVETSWQRGKSCADQEPGQLSLGANFLLKHLRKKSEFQAWRGRDRRGRTPYMEKTKLKWREREQEQKRKFLIVCQF